MFVLCPPFAFFVFGQPLHSTPFIPSPLAAQRTRNNDRFVGCFRRQRVRQCPLIEMTNGRQYWGEGEERRMSTRGKRGRLTRGKRIPSASLIFRGWLRDRHLVFHPLKSKTRSRSSAFVANIQDNEQTAAAGTRRQRLTGA